MPKRPPSLLAQSEALRQAEQVIRALELKRDVEDCEDDLKFFLECAWPILQPGEQFQDNWHISCLCLPSWSNIETENGPVPIGEMSGYRGKILSWDHNSNSPQWRNVSAWMKSPGKPMVRIETESGESILLTHNHPVFVDGKGYIDAGKVQNGDRVLRVLQELIPATSVGENEILQNEVFRKKQGPTSESVCRLRRENVMGKCVPLPPVLEERGAAETSFRQYSPMQAMWHSGASSSVPNENDISYIRSVLRFSLFRDVCAWSKQSSLLQRSASRAVSGQVQVCEKEGVGSRGEPLLHMRCGGEHGERTAPVLDFGRAPYRPRQEKYVSGEFGGPVSEMSPQGRRGGEVGSRRFCASVVQSVEREIPGPEFVYNIEVEGNHNYFADSFLVHNCEHLQALARREIKRLIINMPPRMLKSTLIAVALPAWIWLKSPAEKFLVASFGMKLALRDSRRCRNLIASQWYQARWASRFNLAADQNEKGRFENDKGGFRIIASVEGGVLGEGGSFRIIDDANDIERMNKEPETYPQDVRDWYSGSMSSRSINPKSDVILNVQQRSSYGSDLTEYLHDLGGWEQAVIPNEWEGAKTIGPLAFPDPRTRHGELMFPERFGPTETDNAKREQKTHYQGQYQQRPTVGGKNGLRREWFRFYNPPGMGVVDAEGNPRPIRMSLGDGTFAEIMPVELPPAFEQAVQSWDCAFKGTEESDFVAGHTWGRIGSSAYLLERDTQHRNFPETLTAIRGMSERFPCPEKLVETAANGRAVIDTLTNEIPGIIGIPAVGNKWSRVSAISGYIEAGNVHLPNPDLFPWVWDLLSEFAAGQAAKHDDDTDAMSQALKRLYDANARAGVPEFRIAPRLGEPTSAVHISSERVPVDCRRFVAAVPGRAAVWVAELRSGALRVTAELSMEKLDAGVAGREIARRILPDILARAVPITGRRPGYEVFLPKRAFAPMEAVGSWAEMMEMSLLGFEPEDEGWDGRNRARATLQSARIRTDMVEEEDQAALDRLRGMLVFQPPDFRQLNYDRGKALRLAEEDLREYHRYLGMVEGRVVGEWPKLKISPQCKQLIAELGAFRKDVPAAPFVEALLLAVCAPRTVVEVPEVRNTPWPAVGRSAGRSATLLGKRFARR